jgi:CO dehydrogenase maturation factor
LAMGRVIVSTGRGGAGKSTFVALASKYLNSPKLLIDLDPDESLADMLGVDLNEKGKKTISSALYDAIEENKGVGRSGYNLLSEVLQPVLYRGTEFDLITLGTKFTVGCYCAPDAVLKDFIPTLVKDYDEVLVDSPAGLEHFNRKVVVDIDDLFVLLDPSEKSIKHIERVKGITRELKVGYDHLYLIGNHRFTEETEEYLRSAGEAYLGKIDYDPTVKRYNLEGRSLLELPGDSPAALSVKRILAKAGYRITDGHLASESSQKIAKSSPLRETRR